MDCKQAQVRKLVHGKRALGGKQARVYKQVRGDKQAQGDKPAQGYDMRVHDVRDDAPQVYGQVRDDKGRGDEERDDEVRDDEVRGDGGDEDHVGAFPSQGG